MRLTPSNHTKRHFMRSAGLWVCFVIGLSWFVAQKSPQGGIEFARAHAADQFSTSQPARTSHVDPRVTLTFQTLDLSTITPAAYGDAE